MAKRTEYTRAQAIALISRQAARILGSQDNATEWLNTPNQALGMAKPIDLLGTGSGATQVRSVLSAIEHGGPV
ncbi:MULTISPECIES: MbcA/ParS/Xre antitoxin family protein [Gammaproteobacteria]|jgi:putative toxin-antitoxin system antitoxin component (TIGR02293 family)|uniref:MbcA/ParS/Xre antitoxin family protein n=1 Tax=Gammaproteobacteria TaxID=1236 RepID=UPI000789CA76|nr:MULTISPECIES: MbcA/ParS/Xre antitoxin family protein [Gammaproteobacteria]MDX5329387.1 MbcA/ParS/Xre antitoxin family protein [Marinobacter sp.]KXJ43140.1 MAG: hypothetical protein AXW11_18130 [Marinobacter sp. Hex_13]MAC13564.1 DUF2384 domain-containing protein [Alcanivorax sp.]MBU85338.1 DUF2384 domain-containing protein [Alcanivorax sp.]SEG24173.1 putative toxin-antitoxin system antitoxin component, TIGR02293 family [Alcanivorax sp. DSM 26293]|tara:strand:+ start:1010 stop:1228 length:219 start_codon:yes stop_codon:yes gene_type:complete